MSEDCPAKKILLVVLLLASMNLGWQFYRMHQEEVGRQELQEEGFCTCCVGPRLDELSRVKIELCLIVAFVGSRLKGFKSLLLSVVGLSGTAVCYLFWWDHYFRLAALISEPELVFVEHIGYLYRANFLDLAIAATVAFVILIHLKDAVSRRVQLALETPLEEHLDASWLEQIEF